MPRPPLFECLRALLRIAGAVVLTAAWAGGVAAVLPLVRPDLAPPDPRVVEGRRIFTSRCASCHSLEPEAAGRLGPGLHRIGAIASERRPGLSAAEYILESIVDPGAYRPSGTTAVMPERLVEDLPDPSVRGLVAFLAGQGAVPDSEAIFRLEVPAPEGGSLDERLVTREAMERAVDVFRGEGRCTECHGLHRGLEYQVRAPAVFGSGQTDPESIRESIVEPDASIAPAYRNVNVFLRSGRVAAGRLIERGPERLVLLELDATGAARRRVVPLDQVVRGPGGEPRIQTSEVSSMPTGYDELLEPGELDALVELIRALN